MRRGTTLVYTLYVCVVLIYIPVGGWLRRIALILMFPRSATYSVPSGETTKEEGQLSLASLAYPSPV